MPIGEELKEAVDRLDAKHERLSEDLQGWKARNHKDKSGIYIRLNAIERKALFIPSAQETELIKEAQSPTTRLSESFVRRSQPR